MLEKTFEDNFLLLVSDLPYSFVPEKPTADQHRGIPDRVICLNGLFVALEFKKSKKELNKTGAQLQAYRGRTIQRAGGIFYFVYPENATEIFKILQGIAYEIKPDPRSKYDYSQ